jgi:hypothetical protein
MARNDSRARGKEHKMTNTTQTLSAIDSPDKTNTTIAAIEALPDLPEYVNIGKIEICKCSTYYNHTREYHGRELSGKKGNTACLHCSCPEFRLANVTTPRLKELAAELRTVREQLRLQVGKCPNCGKMESVGVDAMNAKTDLTKSNN